MKQAISGKRRFILAVALMVVVPGVAYAHDSAAEDMDMSTSEQMNSARETAKDKMQSMKEEANQRVEAAKARLQDSQLKRCQAKEKAITTIMGNVATRGQKQLDLFSTIATRVENFYTEKGNTLDNYDSLVADMNAKKEAAQAVVDEVEGTDTSFTCSGDNPRGVIDGFKASLKKEITALKEYRTSVKNLIVGVKSAQSATPSDTTEEGDQQ